MPDIFHSIPDKCEYIHHEEWRQMVFWLKTVTPKSMDILLEIGFRHFGYYFFRNDCIDCNSCRGLRVDTANFTLTKSQRRVKSKNKDLKIDISSRPLDFDDKELINRWQAQREDLRDWTPHPFSEREFLEAFAPIPLVSFFVRLYDPTGKLIALSVIDKGIKASNSIYAVFCPDHHQRSLGTLLGIIEIEWGVTQGISHHYFGHFNPESKSLSYKNRFQPHQLSDYRNIPRDGILKILHQLPEWNEDLERDREKGLL